MLKRVYQGFMGWPLVTRLVLLAGILAVAAIAGWQGYEYYDYVEHDNDFCMSCHLMEEPFRRYEESGHNGLSCKACHKPTLVERSRMAATQVIQNPGEIETHAHVPNKVCAACHIDGDPEKWKVIANTPGHRVHLESGDPELAGLQCVKCHSASVHDFVPLDRTCAQAGCHPETKVTLGGMSTATDLHCTGCHNFLADRREFPVGDQPRDLTPRQQDCLECHQTVASLAPFEAHSEPHGAECSKCHNPHEQTVPADAVHSCATAGCHDNAGVATAWHRGLAESSLARCTDCHDAHEWTVASTGCRSCHSDPGQPSASFAGFRHQLHRGVECTSCHSSEERHGALTVGAGDCSSCHHGATQSPVAQGEAACRQCHGASELAGDIGVRLGQAPASAPGLASRDLPFDHSAHRGQPCRRCHDGSPAMAVNAACGDCHVDHHEPERDCTRCHGQQVMASHDIGAHDGCRDAGCHVGPAGVSWLQLRNDCLVCHVDQRDHEVGSDCSSCHFMPPGGEGAGR